MDFLDWLLNTYLTYYNSDDSNEEEEENNNEKENDNCDLLSPDELEKIATSLIDSRRLNVEEDDNEEEEEEETYNCDEHEIDAIDAIDVKKEYNGGYRVGWVCPMCGTVVSPYVHTCPHCSARERILT